MAQDIKQSNKRKTLFSAVIILGIVLSGYILMSEYVFAGIDPWAHQRSATEEVGEYDKTAILDDILKNAGIDPTKLSSAMKNTIMAAFNKAFNNAFNAKYGCGKAAKSLSELLEEDRETWMGAFERQVKFNLERELQKDLKSGVLTDYEKEVWEVYERLGGFYIDPSEDRRMAALEARRLALSINSNDYVFLASSDTSSSNLTKIVQAIIGRSMNELLQTPEAQKCLECMFKALIKKCVVACVQSGGESSKCQKNCEKMFLFEFQKNNQNLSGYPKVIASEDVLPPGKSSGSGQSIGQSDNRQLIPINASKTCAAGSCNISVSAKGVFSARVWEFYIPLGSQWKDGWSGSSFLVGEKVTTHQPQDGNLSLSFSLTNKEFSPNVLLIQATPQDGNKYNDNEVRVECLSCFGDNSAKNELDKQKELADCGKDGSGKKRPHTICRQGGCAKSIWYECVMDYETCGMDQCDIINKTNIQEVCKAVLSGSTKSECDPGKTLCGTSCVDLNWDSKHCGSCNNACGNNKVCNGGNCIDPPSAIIYYYCNTINGTCSTEITTGGAYSSLAECQTACKAPTPEQKKYSCNISTWTCQEDTNGQYSSLTACQAACKKTVYYGCKQTVSSYTCVEQWDGQYNSLEACQAACKHPGYYGCNKTTYMCEARWDGQYSSLSECQKSCTPPSPPPQ